jgi:hypothetical protein
MSGISSRTSFDNCALSQLTKTSVGPSEYALFLDYNISPTFRYSKDVVCNANDKQKIKCDSCDVNKNAIVNLGPESFGLRSEIQDNLNGITRNLTKCASEKFLSCQFNVPNRKKGECENYIAVTPKLCERNIVPTNLKFPTNKGF